MSLALIRIKNMYSMTYPNALRMHVGPIASGSAVIADTRILKGVQDQKRELLGVEMEVYGLYAAVASASRPKPSALAFKSVCDFANTKKNDEHQGYAAYTAANALKEFFERYMHELADMAAR